MTKTQLVKTLDTIENTLGSLRGLIDDIFAQDEVLKRNQEENVSIRKQIIGGQNKVLEDLKKTKEIEKVTEKKQESLKLERLDIDRMIETSDKRKLEIKEQELKLDEKMEVSGNLTKWTNILEDKEFALKALQARVNADKRSFEEEKARIKLLEKSNAEYKLSLDRRKKQIDADQARVANILGNV